MRRYLGIGNKNAKGGQLLGVHSFKWKDTKLHRIYIVVEVKAGPAHWEPDPGQ